MQENCIINNYQNRDHWILQIKGFDWLTKRAMVYESLYHALEIATIKLSSAGCTCKAKLARNINISFFLIIPLMLVGYEVIKAKEARTYPTRAHGTIIPQASVRYETIELAI